jgi:hypothetical protein
MWRLQHITAPTKNAGIRGGICKSGRQLIIFALQMANKHLALLVSFSVENGFKTALLVAANRYKQLY